MAEYDQTDCIHALRTVADELGETPARRAYDEHRPDDAPGSATVVNKFGGWNAAKEAADLDTLGEYNANPTEGTLVNEHYFDDLNHEKAYWLGFLHADAWMGEKPRLELSVQRRDGDHLREFADAIESEYAISEITKGNSEQIVVKMGGRHLTDRLRELGVTNNKSHSQTIPVELLENERLEYAFIRGYWDGDGNYDEQGKRKNWSLHAAHEPRLRVILRWLRGMGVYGGGVYGGNESSRLVITAAPDLAIMRDRLYPDGYETEPALERKRDNFIGGGI